MSAAMRRKLTNAAARLEAARIKRDQVIVEASNAGMSRREVAEAVGLTAGRIQHIVDSARTEPNA